MNDPLTVREVESYARRALGALYSVPLPASTPNSVRRKIDQAAEQLNELLLLCDLVDVVDSGIAVVVERERDAGA